VALAGIQTRASIMNGMAADHPQGFLPTFTKEVQKPEPVMRNSY